MPKPTRVLRAACLLALALILQSCRESDNEAAISSFLSEQDPAAKAQRDHWLATIRSLEKQRDDLEDLASNYQSQTAREKLQGQIGKLDSEINRHKARLAEIDAAIELAMLARDLERTGAAGLKSREAEEAMEKSNALLNQAIDLNKSIAPPASGNAVAGPAPKPADNSCGDLPPKALVIAPSTMDPTTLQLEIERNHEAIIACEMKWSRADQGMMALSSQSNGTLERGSSAHRRYIELRQLRSRYELELGILKNRRDELAAHLSHRVSLP